MQNFNFKHLTIWMKKKTRAESATIVTFKQLRYVMLLKIALAHKQQHC